ncbi:MAG TPA: C25 family cysteine peptidase, partial [Acidobacteriota bacterium]
ALRVQEIFLGQSGIGTARAELLAALNRGVLMVQYFGHGSESTWSSQGLLTIPDVQALTNGLNLPVVIAMNCFNGLFQDVYSESLAEALLNAEQGGAVAVWASSGATDPNQQMIMDRALAQLLFETSTLGEAILRAKLAVPDQDVRRTWILFGDPATRLR